MKQQISLKEALQVIDLKDAEGKPLPFNISFRTLQRQSKTGGGLRTINGAAILTPLPKQTTTTQSQKVKFLQTPNKTRRNPNHFANRTRNIQKPNGEIAKVRIRLIESINNQKVVY